MALIVRLRLGEAPEKLIKRFQKKVAEEKILEEVRKRQFYRKPSEIKKERKYRFKRELKKDKVKL